MKRIVAIVFGTALAAVAVDLPTALTSAMKAQCSHPNLNQCLDAMRELGTGSEAAAFAILTDGQPKETVTLYTTGRRREDFWVILLDAIAAPTCDPGAIKPALERQLNRDSESLRIFKGYFDHAKRAEDPWVKAEWNAKAFAELATGTDAATIRNYVACRKDHKFLRQLTALKVGDEK